MVRSVGEVEDDEGDDREEKGEVEAVDDPHTDEGGSEVKGVAGVGPFFNLGRHLGQDQRQAAQEFEDGKQGDEVKWIAEMGDTGDRHRASKGQDRVEAFHHKDNRRRDPENDFVFLHTF